MPAAEPPLVVVATEAERPPAFRGEVLVCGVGKTGAAAATAARLAKGGVRAVVSFGVAGAYPSEGLAVGDVVVASEVGVVDEGLDDGARFTPFAAPFDDDSERRGPRTARGAAHRTPGAAPFDDDSERRGPRTARGAAHRTPGARAGMPVPGAGWTTCDVSLAGDAPGGANFRVVRGRIATVSVCAGSTRLAAERAATGALAEGMEGAAVAHAAMLFGLPFAEVRGISNLCGPRDGARFDLALAVANAARCLR